MPRIRVHDRASADIDEIAGTIARDNLDAALRFYDATEKAFDLLARMPGAGAIVEDAGPHFAGLRMWPIRGFRNYLVCYLRLPDGIEVLRVLHGARDVTRIFR